MHARLLAPALLLPILAACASGPQPPPYAFIQTDELSDVFMASLPGIRARQLAGDEENRTTSKRIDLPADWSGTTGGAPGKALEIFVLTGEMTIADVALQSNGYAYVPPGSLGFNLRSDTGAQILYFLTDVDRSALIRTPIILDAGLVDWQPGDTPGTFIKLLRADPGSGARSWLLRIDPGAELPWQASTATLEGYLVSGDFRDTECVGDEPYTSRYTAGGYFYRPAQAVHGGPEAAALSPAVWFLRELRQSEALPADGCAP